MLYNAEADMAIQKKHYDIEKAGQIDFFDNYRIDYRGDASILVDNTDGVYHGNIMEFKLNISNTGKVPFQAIKYLMDCPSDRRNRKDLGAFYTPGPYCRKAAELVEMAVARVPDGNDHIILDRLEPLPLFSAKLFQEEQWHERDVYATTPDGGDAYAEDGEFLKSCLVHTCLSNQNKCLSFTGSDGRHYRNELRLDTASGDTVASADLATMTPDDESGKLLALWEKILAEAKKTANYNPKPTYGVYQIARELNTSHEEGTGIRMKTVYDHPSLDSYLVSLRDSLKEYYRSHIADKMFKYELLK